MQNSSYLIEVIEKQDTIIEMQSELILELVSQLRQYDNTYNEPLIEEIDEMKRELSGEP